VTVLVVGRGLIGRAVAAALPPAEVRLASHTELPRADVLDGVATVLFTGRNPTLGTDAWRITDDPEMALARRAAEGHRFFVSLGTRKVYAPCPRPLSETDRVAPADPYGRHKLELEHALAATLGPRLTRLRLGNLFGYETAPGRTTFMAQMLAGLKRRDEIRFAVSPFVRRDFLPVERGAAWIATVARRPPGGVVNVGSGVALPVGRLALWLIEGFGRGRLVVESPTEEDSFVLDATLLRGLLGGVPSACTEADLRASCHAIGRRLRAELGPPR
jgi:UDP-glucose 4-epimerase